MSGENRDKKGCSWRRPCGGSFVLAGDSDDLAPGSPISGGAAGSSGGPVPGSGGFVPGGGGFAPGSPISGGAAGSSGGPVPGGGVSGGISDVGHSGGDVGLGAQARRRMLGRLVGAWRFDAWVRPYFGRYKKVMLVSLGLGIMTLLCAVLLMFMSGFLISYAALPPAMGLFSLYIPIGFVQIFGIGKPFLGYFERLASHDWVLQMTSSLRKKLYCSLERENIAGSLPLKMGEALGLLSEDISHIQNLYLRTVFPLLVAWLTSGLVVLAAGLMNAPCAVMLFVGFMVIALLLPLQALLASGARSARRKALKAQMYANAYDDVMGIADWICAQRKEDFQAAVTCKAGDIDEIERKLAVASRWRNFLLDVLFSLMAVMLLVWAGGFFGTAEPGAFALSAGSLSDGRPAIWIAAVVLGFFPLLDAFRPLPDAAVAVAGHIDSVERLNVLDRLVENEGDGACPAPQGRKTENEGVGPCPAPQGGKTENEGVGPWPEPQGMDIRLNDVSFAYGFADGQAAQAARSKQGTQAARSEQGTRAAWSKQVTQDAQAMQTVQTAQAMQTVPRDDFLLRDVSLTIEHGQKVAILGPSGSGKSTLLHLIRGDLMPAKGTVSLGGVATSALNDAGMIHQYLGYMQQSSYLFAQSLKGNLKVGNPKVTDEQAYKALQEVCLQPLLDRLPDGLETSVDESGLRFSGGERQRIALARLLLAQTPVVLLDEPTVSLDPLTEAKLLDTIFDVLKDRTVVMVTHHLLGIEHVDRILFIQDNRIFLDGSPRELAKSSAFFRRLLAFDHGVER